MKDNLKEYSCTVSAIYFYNNVSITSFVVLPLSGQTRFVGSPFSNAVDFPIQTAGFSILSALLLASNCPVRGGSCRQAVQPGAAGSPGHAWVRGTGVLLSVLAVPPRHNACGVPAQGHIRDPSFPLFLYTCPRRQLINRAGYSLGTSPKTGCGPDDPLGRGAVRRRCRAAAGSPPSPSAAALPEAVAARCCPGRDPPARRPAAGGGRGSEDGGPPRLFRPGVVPPTLRRGSCLPSPLPLLGTPFGERRGPGRGRLPALEEPLGGEAGAAAAWPGPRHHVSHPQPGGRGGRPQVTAAPTSAPGQRNDGAAGPRGHSAGNSSHTHLGPPPPRREKPSAGRRGKQARQLSLGWVGGWPSRRGAAGNAHPPPCARRVPFSRREAGSARGGGCGDPGLPSHIHTGRAAAMPGGETGRALPAPWTEMLPWGEQTARTRTGLRAG